MTQNTIDVWNWAVNNTAVTTTTYQATSSVLPPPFVITDDPNPESSPGVTHPVQTRNITAPPYPYSIPYASTTSDAPSKTSSTTAAAVIFPSIHFTRGPPGPTCLSGCGHKCKIFCNTPCLFCGGIDGGLGFNDPGDPNPPPGPMPGPPPNEPGNEPTDEGDTCDPELSDEQGMCDNGNFPLYNPGTGAIDCSYSSDAASYLMSACQAHAMQNPDETQAIIEQGRTCCDPPSKRDTTAWGKFTSLFRRAKSCSPTQTPGTPSQPADPVPMPTYTCPAKFPNVCANAKSGATERNYGTILTRNVNPKNRYTASFWTNKERGMQTNFDETSAGYNAKTPLQGWGLIGCNVEEYPFASGNTGNEATIRMVPDSENTLHARDLLAFYKEWDRASGDPNFEGGARIRDGERKNNGKQFAIAFESGVADTESDYGLLNNALDNVCARPYGVEFILAAGPLKGKRGRDPWFDRDTSRLATYTVIKNNGQNTVTAVAGPQYCLKPSPGRMALVNGAFSLNDEAGDLIGVAATLDDNDMREYCEPWPPRAQKIKAREEGSGANEFPLTSPHTAPTWTPAHPRHAPALGSRDLWVHGGKTFAISNATSDNRTLSQAAKRQKKLSARQMSGGSYLDPNVYAFLDCSNDDYDPCEWGQICGGTDFDDGTDGGGSDGMTTTSPPMPTTSKPSSTSKPQASTTESTSSNCKVCIGVVGTPVSCSFVNGCTPTTPTASPTPPPSKPSTSTPPAPQQTKSNNKGSGLCASLTDESAQDSHGQNMCQVAYNRYLDDYLYTQYTSYTYTADDAFNTALDVFFRGKLRGLVGQEGCTAYFKCDSDEAYSRGITGAQIKSAFANLYAHDKVKTCGSSYLDNGCHVTANGCNDCLDVGVVCSRQARNCE